MLHQEGILRLNIVEPETSSTDLKEKATMRTGSTEAVSTFRKRLCEPKKVFENFPI